MKSINVKVIPHKEQRYDTCGDWWFEKDGTLEIRVSSLGDPHMEYLVAAHEIDEAIGCAKEGIGEQAVNEFDEAYEAARTKQAAAPCGCTPTKTSEPGNDKHAPYRKWHQLATSLEKQRAKTLGVSWRLYEKKINALKWR